MSDISIRSFDSRDVDPVMTIWNRALVRDPINVSRFVQWLFGDPDYWPGDDSGFFVATQGQQAIGFLRAIIRRWPNDRLGLEPEHGWMPVLAVDPSHQRQGIGTALLERGLAYLKAAGRRHVWVCGNSGAAPGYVFPGIDKQAYAGALALLTKHGFVIDHEPVSMSREVVDFDIESAHREAWKTGQNIRVLPLSTERVQEFLTFLAAEFPGDWNMAARAKIRAGALHEVLIALQGETVVGYCQWEGEHFGPFGVTTAIRSQGIGAKLFVEAVRRIRAADGRTVWFNWADDAAARFYARFGLKPQRHFAILRRDL
jgi:mycothiol synthase